MNGFIPVEDKKGLKTKLERQKKGGRKNLEKCKKRLVADGWEFETDTCNDRLIDSLYDEGATVQQIAKELKIPVYLAAIFLIDRLKIRDKLKNVVIRIEDKNKKGHD